MASTAARRASVRGRFSPATRSDVHRASSTSGAPLVTTTTRPSPSRSASNVLMSLRSEVNGISPTRRKRARRASVSPIFASATRNAASVGSPRMDHTPPSWRKPASLARLPATSTAPTSSTRPGSASGRPSTRSSPSGRYPLPVTSTSPEGVTTFSMVISFRVRVPVLSEHTTEADPNVSTDDSFLTIARSPAMRCTPKASTTDRIAGSPSGTAATASDTPTSNTSTRSEASPMSVVSRMAATTTTAMTTTASPRVRPIRSTSRCSGVRSSSVWPSRRATVPISVAMPVAVTTARPRPRVTAVPLQTMLTRSPSAAGPASGATALHHRFALTRERRLGHRERGGLHETGVGADRVTLRQHQDVAGNQVGGRDAFLPPAAPHAGGGRRHALQCGDRLLGPRLLHVPQRAVGHDDRRDHDDLERHPLARPRAPRPPSTRPRHRSGGRPAGRRTGRGACATVAPARWRRAGWARSAPGAPPPRGRSVRWSTSEANAAATPAASWRHGSGAGASRAALTSGAAPGGRARCAGSRART